MENDRTGALFEAGVGEVTEFTPGGVEHFVNPATLPSQQDELGSEQESLPTSQTKLWRNVWAEWSEGQEREIEVEECQFSEEELLEHQLHGRTIVYVPKELSGGDSELQLASLGPIDIVENHERKTSFYQSPSQWFRSSILNLSEQSGWLAVGERIAKNEEKEKGSMGLEWEMELSLSSPTINTFMIWQLFQHLQGMDGVHKLEGGGFSILGTRSFEEQSMGNEMIGIRMDIGYKGWRNLAALPTENRTLPVIFDTTLDDDISNTQLEVIAPGKKKLAPTYWGQKFTADMKRGTVKESDDEYILTDFTDEDLKKALREQDKVDVMPSRRSSRNTAVDRRVNAGVVIVAPKGPVKDIDELNRLLCAITPGNTDLTIDTLLFRRQKNLNNTQGRVARGVVVITKRMPNGNEATIPIMMYPSAEMALLAEFARPSRDPNATANQRRKALMLSDLARSRYVPEELFDRILKGERMLPDFMDILYGNFDTDFVLERIEAKYGPTEAREEAGVSEAFAQQIVIARRNQKKSIGDLAQELSIPPSVLFAIENGTISSLPEAIKSRLTQYIG